jgi:hypothetical protein
MVIGYHAVLSRHFIVGGEIFEVDDYSQMQRVKTFSSADEKSCKILHSRNFLCQLKTSTDDSPGGYCRMQRGVLHIILKVGHPKIISNQISEQKILM